MREPGWQRSPVVETGWYDDSVDGTDPDFYVLYEFPTGAEARAVARGPFAVALKAVGKTLLVESLGPSPCPGFQRVRVTLGLTRLAPVSRLPAPLRAAAYNRLAALVRHEYRQGRIG